MKKTRKRLSSSKKTFQNTMKRKEAGRKIRNMNQKGIDQFFIEDKK
jgi:hypothetical protein